MLLTRLPLPIARAFDLHVLGLPPAFVLSQDQTLRLKVEPGFGLEVNPRIFCVTGTFTLDRRSRLPRTTYHGDGLKRSIARVFKVSSMLSMKPRPARTPPPAFLFLRLTCQRAKTFERTDPFEAITINCPVGDQRDLESGD